MYSVVEPSATKGGSLAHTVESLLSLFSGP